MTAQFGENMHYEGREVVMCNEPLGDYFKLAGIEPEFDANCTALWRGYLGTWEIRDARLYLVGLVGVLKGLIEANVATIFPGYPDRVFAHWYSGTLRVPEGKILQYAHGGYGSTYESDLLITIDKGVVTQTHVRQNGISDDPDATEIGYGIRGMYVFARQDPDKEAKL
jgi:hypothetical protein